MLRLWSAALSLVLTAGLLVGLGSTANAAPPWTQQVSPSTTNANDTLSSVSCVSSTTCVAVGSSVTGGFAPLVLTTTDGGQTWVKRAIANPMIAAYLNAVSCSDALTCVAVGQGSNGGAYESLVERTTDGGVTWSQQTSPNPGTDNFLYDVSCASTSQCVAVGSTRPASVTDTFAITSTDGGVNWSTATSANPSGTYNQFSGVTCPTELTCYASGIAAVSGENVGLVERSTDGGVNWSDVSPVHDSGSDDILAAISCPTVNRCVSVGHRQGGPQDETLVQVTENAGSSWVRRSSPSPDVSNFFNDVDCNPNLHCTAVGAAKVNAPPPSEVLIAASDDGGETWSSQPGVNPSDNTNLYGVSCVADSRCTAVGASSPDGDYVRTLIELRADVAVQRPLNSCVTAPKRPKGINSAGLTRLTKPNCRTNAGRAVRLSVRCSARPRGDLTLCRLVKRRDGSHFIRTFGHRLRVAVVWSAPATPSYTAYKSTRHYLS